MRLSGVLMQLEGMNLYVLGSQLPSFLHIMGMVYKQNI